MQYQLFTQPAAFGLRWGPYDFSQNHKVSAFYTDGDDGECV
ncbi:MAG: hypothetical protein ACQEW0_10205 [Pseudomonadota bacterium]